MKRRMGITEPQVRALRWLRDHGGHAVLTRYGKALAHGETNSADASTWLRLFISGHVAVSPMPGHMGITMKGLEAAK
jgi:hypothetical protein